MATAALWVASGWLPPAARAVARDPDCPRPQRRGMRCRRVSLCQDTVGHAIEQLWPAIRSLGEDCQSISASKLSPRTFELRLRQSARLLQDLQQLSAVSPNLASRVDGVGWSATHEYLFQEPGSKAKLRRRYAESMRQLLLKTWLRRCAAQEPEGLVAHIVSFVPG
mmetsp:Transcript_52774/g.109123  ORF Transcript_52774/g.109123 Transcript_52774/m.109123 type:complete len:166 (+) Transcript_52774:47-544(+)